MSTRIKVMVVDDHRIFIDGLTVLLQQFSDIEVVGSALNADDAVKEAGRLQPHVMLMDIQMPDKDGITATRDIHKNWPYIKVIALTSANESLYIKKMLEAGASAYVLKNIDKAELYAVIKKVLSGEKHLDAAVSSELIKNYNNKSVAPESSLAKLTRREKEILILIAQGFTDKEIAEKVFLSALTVITHRKNILGKLGLKNKVEITRFAMENKLI